jgi:hypothetical protein
VKGLNKQKKASRSHPLNRHAHRSTGTECFVFQGGYILFLNAVYSIRTSVWRSGGGGLITFTAPCTVTVFLLPYDVNSTFSINSRKRPTGLLSGLPRRLQQLVKAIQPIRRELPLHLGMRPTFLSFFSEKAKSVVRRY